MGTKRKMQDGDSIELWFKSMSVVGTVLNAPNGLVTFIEPNSTVTHADEIKPGDYIWSPRERVWVKDINKALKRAMVGIPANITSWEDL